MSGDKGWPEKTTGRVLFGEGKEKQGQTFHCPKGHLNDCMFLDEPVSPQPRLVAMQLNVPLEVFDE